jgi:hypothetical protein
MDKSIRIATILQTQAGISETKLQLSVLDNSFTLARTTKEKARIAYEHRRLTKGLRVLEGELRRLENEERIEDADCA